MFLCCYRSVILLQPPFLGILGACELRSRGLSIWIFLGPLDEVNLQQTLSYCLIYFVFQKPASVILTLRVGWRGLSSFVFVSWLIPSLAQALWASRAFFSFSDQLLLCNLLLLLKSCLLLLQSCTCACLDWVDILKPSLLSKGTCRKKERSALFRACDGNFKWTRFDTSTQTRARESERKNVFVCHESMFGCVFIYVCARARVHVYVCKCV